jgi:L-cysteine/cystine lyase
MVLDRVDDLRAELNLPEDVIAVNAGSWGPLCNAARKEIKRGYRVEAESRGDNPTYMKEKVSGLTRYGEVIDEAKEEVSRLLGCTAEEVALCDSTTTGMNIFIWGYDWIPGEEILTGSLENPAAIIPLKVLASRKSIKLRFVDLEMGYTDIVQKISEAITEKTRMILISEVDYATGSRIDLKTLCKIAHENDVLVLVDGVQAVGNHQVDVKDLGVDGYSISRHKFLCGPEGAGALYVKNEVMEYIQPTFTGVFSDAYHGSQKEFIPATTAQRYEVSTRPLPVIRGGTAATRWVRESVGLDYILRRCRRLYNRLWDEMNQIENVILVSKRAQNSLLLFSIRNKASKLVVETLRRKNIFTRKINRFESEPVRISIGFWNRETDIAQILKTLRQL